MIRSSLKLVIFILVVYFLNPTKYAYSEEYIQKDTLRKKAYNLSLEEITRLALLNNFEIQLAKYDTWIARTDQNVVESIYDTIFSAEIEYQNDQKKPVSTTAGTKTLDNDYNVGLSKKMPSGTTVSVDLKNNRNWSNSPSATSPLIHDSTLGIAIKQELGKNFFGIQDRGDVKITRINIENAEYTSMESIEETVAEIQKAYWSLVLEVETAKIEEDSVSQAKRLYDLHQEKLADGLVELPDIIASEANYKKRISNSILQKNQVDTKVNVLRLLLNITDDNVTIVPTQIFGLCKTVVVLNDSLEQAFSHRQDYKRTHNEIKARNVKLLMEKNNIWPEINLTASLNRNGLGDHFKQAVTQITEENNSDFFAGLTFSFPLENSKAKGQLKAAELEKAEVLLKLKFLERKIAIEIVDQVRDCNIFQELAFKSEEISDLQARKLAEEEKRFQQGRSDTDTLIRFQEDLFQARAEALQAKYRYHSAVVELNKRMGTLLYRYWDGEI